MPKDKDRSPSTAAWDRCVAGLSDDHLRLLWEWRNCSLEFFQKLRTESLVGIWHDRIAFPITDGPDGNGDVLGCHHRPIGGPSDWKVESFTAERVKMHPYRVNAPNIRRKVMVFESQWDMYAFMFAAGWHEGKCEDIGFLATRGASNFRKVSGNYLPGATIWAFGQNDEPGRAWLSGVARIGDATVKSVAVPPRFKDLNDWIKSGATSEEVLRAVDQSTVIESKAVTGDVAHTGESDEIETAYDGPPPLESNEDGRILVQLPDDNRLLSDFATDMGRAMSEAAVFNRNGLAFILSNRTKGLLRMTAEQFRTWAEFHAVCFVWHRSKNGRFTRVKSSMGGTDAVAVLASVQFLENLRPLQRVNHVPLPVLRQSGRVELLPNGYDLESQTYTFESGLNFQKEISLEEAKATIDDLFSEFCFPDDGGRSLAVAVAGMMTLFARGLLPQSALFPCLMIGANAEGAGKTLLLKVMIVPVYGSFVAGSKPTNEEELRKYLLAAVMEGRPFIVFDNIKQHLDSGSLEAFLTSSTWTDRILGSSKTFMSEKNTVVFLTGNSCTMSPDMRRRSLFVQLFMKDERSETRTFKTALDVPYLLEKRGEILNALWKMVKAWDQNGRPPGTGSNSSFPEWSRTIAAIVENAGYPSPATVPEFDDAADRDGADMRKLVVGLDPTLSLRAFSFSEFTEYAREVGAFESVVGTDGELDLQKRALLSRILKRYVGRYVGAYVFLIEGTPRNRRLIFKRINPAAGVPDELHDY